MFQKTYFLNKKHYFLKFECLHYSLYLGQFLGYLDPLYNFGILKVLWLRISNGFNGFLKLEELWSKRPVSFLPNKSLVLIPKELWEEFDYIFFWLVYNYNSWNIDAIILQIHMYQFDFACFLIKVKLINKQRKVLQLENRYRGICV